MKLFKLTPKKNTAQAMVEFAIVLPLLLLLLYGLLEAGRLLFMYSTIVTASRQAARYGSATGQGGDYTAEAGIDNTNLQRFQDCYGIKRAAQRVDFLNAFEDDDIFITYDDGPASTGQDPLVVDPATSTPAWKDICNGTGDNGVTPNGNSTRIVVTIGGDFLPIIPRIVPFIARTRADNNPIRAVSARTIITGVSIEVTPPPGLGGPSTGAFSLTITANPNTYTGVGELIQYTFTLTNNDPTNPITGPFTITGAPFAVDCSAATSPLPAGASTNCAIVDYYITQTDVDPPGYVEFTAVASGTGSDGNPVTDDYTSKITYSAPVIVRSMSLTKVASADLVTAGDQITYTFTLTNTGNVPLTGASVSDPKLGGTMTGCSGDLPVAGPPITCQSAPYLVTSTDVQNGPINNTASASAVDGVTPVTATASETVDIYEGSLFLTVDRSPASLSGPGTVTYTYHIKNNTASTLYLQALNSSFPPLSAGYPGTHNCSPGQLNAGATATCTGTYNVTQTDFENAVPCAEGYCIQHTIIANACTEASQCNGNRSRTSNAVTVRVAVVYNPAFSFQSVTVSPTSPTPPATTFPLNHPIVYTYTLRNLGNVTLTLSSPPITDAMIPGAYTCNRTSLAPPGPDLNYPAADSIATCTGTHPISQADLDAGLVASRPVTASATFKTQVLSAVAQAPSVTTFDGPRLRLQITANPTTYTEVEQKIYFIYTLTNTGTVPLSSEYSIIADSLGTNAFCFSATRTLVPGESTDCTGEANVSGPPGSKVTLTAQARANAGGPTQDSNIASVTMTNPVLACNTVVANPSSFTLSGSSMSMSVNNPLAVALQIKNITVSWNHNEGHGGQKKDDHTLKLQSLKIGGGSNLSTGTQNGPSYTYTPSTAQFIPASTPATLFTFNFNQSYDVWEAGPEAHETVTITLDTPGCENVVITLVHP